MIQKGFIFIGRSGCGKGTQAKLLSDFIEKNDPGKKVLYVQAGSEFREFIKGNLETQKLCKVLYDEGGIQPEFLATYMWTNTLINKYEKDNHIIFDGAPRRYHEAGVMNSIFDFYKIKTPTLIHIDISKDEAVRRLLARRRIDDSEEQIEKRLSWYEIEVVPTLEYYKNNPGYDFISIDGERPVEDIYKTLIEKLNLK